MVPFTSLNAEQRALHQLSAIEANTLAGARRAVATVLSEHDLQVAQDAPLALELRQANLGISSLVLLGYGAAVTIFPQKLPNDLLFQVVLKGRLGVECAQGYFEAEEGDAVLIEHLAGRQLHWSADSVQLILRIPRLAVRRALGENVVPICFDRHFSLAEDRTGTIDLVRYIMAQAATGRLTEHGDSIVDLFVRHLLIHHSNYPGVSAPVPAAIWRAEAYMHEHLKDPVTLADLARSAKTTPRTLSANFRRFRGVSPLLRFRDLRLDAVRAVLKSEDGSSVTKTAMTFGFTHLGRFSQAYRARFGELPKTTRLVCRSGRTNELDMPFSHCSKSADRAALRRSGGGSAELALTRV